MISLEPIVTVMGTDVCWIGRFGEKHFKYGDPYTGTLIAIRKGYTAFICAHSGKIISHSEVRQLREELKKEGMNRMAWDRHRKDSTTYEANVNL